MKRLLLAMLAALPLAVAPAYAADNTPPQCYDVNNGRVDNDAGSYVYFQCYDQEGDALTYAVVDGPQHGTVGEITSNGGSSYSTRYTPTPGYVGADSFTYKANDGSADSDVKTYTFDVHNPDPPTCTEPPDVTARPDSDVYFSLDRPGNPPGCTGSPGKPYELLTFRLTNPPAHGHFSGDNFTNGHPTYHSDADYTGEDSFSYVAVNSAGDSNEVTQHITLDPNFNRKPICPTGNYGPDPTLRVGTQKTFALGCYDPDGDTITYTLGRSDTRGTVTDPAQMEVPGGFPGIKQWAVTYTTPGEVGDGNDSFSFTATDDRGAAADDTVVKHVNVRAADYNTAPHCTASPFTQAVENGATGYLSTQCTDDEEDVISYELATQASHGHVTLRKYDQPGGGQAYYSFEYEAPEDYLGDDSFTFKAIDDRGAVSDPLPTVTVKVVKPQPPQCFSQEKVTMRPDRSRGLQMFCFSGNFFTGGGKPPSYVIVDPPAHGTLSTPTSTGSVTYTPDQGFEGDDSFTFKGVNAAGDSAAVTQEIGVSSTYNSKPSCFGNFLGERVHAGGSRTISLGCWDSDGDSLTYTLTDPPHGSLGEVTPPPPDQLFGLATVEYTPDPGFTGHDTFQFKANDGTVDSETATEALDVVDTNAAPLCWSGSVVRVAANATYSFGGSDLPCYDPDGDSLTFSTTQPEHGSIGLPDAHGARTYTPAQKGEDTFTFTANDGQADSNAATMIVKVTDPVAVVAQPVTLPSGEPANVQNYVDSSGESLIGVSSRDVRQFPGSCMPLDVDTDISAGSGGGTVGDVVLALDPAGGGAEQTFPMSEGDPGTWSAHIDCIAAGDLSVRWNLTEGGTTTPFSKPLGGIVLIDPQGVVYDKGRYDAAISAGSTPAEARTLAAIEGATVELQRQMGGTWTKVSSGDPGISPNVNPQVTNADGVYRWDVSAGTYRVVVSKPGYTTATSSSVDIPPPVTNLDIALVRAPGGGDQGGDDTGGGGGDDSGGNSGGDGGGDTTPDDSKPADTTPQQGGGDQGGNQPTSKPPTKKKGCSALKGKKRAQCETKQRLKRALAKCSKLKGKKKRSACVKRAKARAKCDSLKGHKKQVCIRRASALGRKP
jgi:hypothetical protein